MDKPIGNPSIEQFLAVPYHKRKDRAYILQIHQIRIKLQAPVLIVNIMKASAVRSSGRSPTLDRIPWGLMGRQQRQHDAHDQNHHSRMQQNQPDGRPEMFILASSLNI